MLRVYDILIYWVFSCKICKDVSEMKLNLKCIWRFDFYTLDICNLQVLNGKNIKVFFIIIPTSLILITSS